MSDQTQSNNSQTIVIALVVVAVLLASLVGVLIYQQSKTAQIAQLTPPAATTTDPAATPPAGMGGAAATGEAVAFDEKTATKVPAGTTVEDYLKAYHEAVVAGKYDVAYKMLPLDKQKSYGDAASYASQVKGYGINGFKLGTTTEEGASATIVARMENPAMPITYTWVFKKVGDTWFVASRTMGGEVK
jgi:hypothetical protein